MNVFLRIRNNQKNNRRIYKFLIIVNLMIHLDLYFSILHLCLDRSYALDYRFDYHLLLARLPQVNSCFYPGLLPHMLPKLLPHTLDNYFQVESRLLGCRLL